METWRDGIIALWEHELAGLREAMDGRFAEILEGILVYSFAVSIVWSVSGLIGLYRQRRSARAEVRGNVPDYTVLIPFHGEPEGARRTAQSLSEIVPRPREIILIDDGSPVPLPASADLPAGSRVLRLPSRRGKSGALKEALRAVSTEVVVCLDADTIAESRDWTAMLGKFADPALGAITGRIWPLSNGSLVGRLQEIDYLAVISVIKTAESLWGGLLTVSGAFVAFRTAALLDVGGWDTDKAAEDIDVSWRLQISGWRIDFDNGWTARVEMAPTVKALWRQRRRWSSGLGQALYDHGAKAIFQGSRHLPVVVVTIANTLWITLMLAFAAAGLWQIFQPSTGSWTEVLAAIDIRRAAVIGLVLFLVQFLVATLIDGRSWRTYLRLLPLLPLYPLYFWSILCTSFVFGFSRGVVRRRLGVWQPTVRAPNLKKA